MFDDILGKVIDYRSIDLKRYNYKSFCPTCKSYNVKDIRDYFSSSVVFVIEKRCRDCYCEWKANMNRDLEIVKVERI